MNVGSICTRNVAIVEAANTLQRAAMLMREHHVGALVVVQCTESAQEVVGIITDRDLVVEAMAGGADAEMVRVSEVCARTLVTVPTTAGIEEAVAALHQRGVRRLLVVTPEGGLAGVVSFDDLLAAVAADLARLADTLRVGLVHEMAARGGNGSIDFSRIRVPADLATSTAAMASESTVPAPWRRPTESRPLGAPPG